MLLLKKKHCNEHFSEYRGLEHAAKGLHSCQSYVHLNYCILYYGILYYCILIRPPFMPNLSGLHSCQTYVHLTPKP